MKPKIVPSVIDILRSVREVMHTLVAPALSGAAERSAVATAEHLLRYSERLIDKQGQTLLDEEIRLKAILPDAANVLDGMGGHSALADALRATVARKRNPTIYVTLAMLQDDVALLRDHVCDLLLALQAGTSTATKDGEALHERLRSYMRWQLAEEGKLVEPAFLGHGPRR
jgi:hypothetical protein